MSAGSWQARFTGLLHSVSAQYAAGLPAKYRLGRGSSVRGEGVRESMSLLEDAETVVKIRLAAAIVVHSDPESQDRILVVQRSQSEKFKPGVWGVPCGKVDPPESPPEAAIRELREETGLRGEIIRPAGTSQFRSRWRGRRADNLQFNYLMRVKPSSSHVDEEGMPEVNPPKDDQESKWVPLSQIDRADLDKHNLRVVRKALAAYTPESDEHLSSESSSSSCRR